jgi:hypothetical protein
MDYQIDIDTFEREVHSEINFLLEYPYPQAKDIHAHYLNFLYSITHDKAQHPREFSERQSLYSKIYGELRRSRFLINKKKIYHLITELEKNDHSSQAAYNELLSREFDKTIERYWLGIFLKAEEARTEATKVIAKRGFRKYICPALQTVTNDAHDIAKIITPILIPLILAKTISIPLEPIIFAQVALIIARMGVASLCEDLKDKDKK